MVMAYDPGQLTGIAIGSGPFHSHLQCVVIACRVCDSYVPMYTYKSSIKGVLASNIHFD